MNIFKRLNTSLHRAYYKNMSPTRHKISHVMGAEFVEQYLERKRRQKVEIIADTAFNILYTQPEIVANFISRHLKK